MRGICNQHQQGDENDPNPSTGTPNECDPGINPFIGDCPEQTMRNVSGVFRVLEETVMHERECGLAKHERQGAGGCCNSGLASALAIHAEHMEHERKRQRPTDIKPTQ